MKRGLVIAAGLLITLVLTLAAFGLDVPSALRTLWQGAAGDGIGLSRTAVKTTPLLLTALGILIAWRAKMFNIGGEGQFIMGGLLGATLFRFAPSLAPGLLNLSILLLSMVGGALYAGLAAWLQVKRGVQVVISTILLNFIALQVLEYSLNGPLRERSGQLPITDRLPNEAMLMRFDRQTDLHFGLFIALALAAVGWVYVHRTVGGFRLRVVGDNESAARANGISVGRVQMTAMMISGGLCGLAGGVEYTGVTGQLSSGFAQNWGFLAIPVALLGGLDPLGVVLSATYFGGLLAGSENLGRYTGVGTTVVFVMQAVAVLGFVGLSHWQAQRAKTKAVMA